MATDPRLLVETLHPNPARRLQPAKLTWQKTDGLGNGRWAVTTGITTLGYVTKVRLDEDGREMPPLTAGQIYASPRVDPKVSRVAYRATARDGAQLGDLADTREDAAALVVGAAHSDDPLPEHVVPRNVGGRPVVGKPINVRLGDDLLGQIDDLAAAADKSRADMLREIVAAGIPMVRMRLRGELESAAGL